MKSKCAPLQNGLHLNIIFR